MKNSKQLQRAASVTLSALLLAGSILSPAYAVEMKDGGEVAFVRTMSNDAQSNDSLYRPSQICGTYLGVNAEGLYEFEATIPADFQNQATPLEPDHYYTRHEISDPTVLGSRSSYFYGIRPGTSDITYSVSETSNGAYTPKAVVHVTVVSKEDYLALTGLDHIHTWQYSYNSNEPTCTKDSVSTRRCTVCQKQEVVSQRPKTEHQYISYISTQPTAFSDGVRTYRCNACGDTYTESIPKLSSGDPAAPGSTAQKPGSGTSGNNTNKETSRPQAPAASQTGNRDSGSTTMKKLSKAEILQLIEEAPLDWSSDVFTAAPSCTAPFALGSVKTSALQGAANRLNLLRRLAGLPDITLDMELCEDAQYSAVIQGYNGSLDHRPAQPAGMSDSFYQRAYAASSSSNLAAGVTLTYAVDGWMDDSDTSNIDRLGHRRWQLNPVLGKVGFGYVEPTDSRYRSYAAEKVFDKSGGRCDYDFIAWPASGNFPSELFSSTTAWSISLNPEQYQTPSQSDLTVSLTRQSDGKTWTFRGDGYAASYQEDYFNVDLGSYAVPNCIIFRPAGIDEYAGSYTIRIEGLKTTSGQRVENFTYEVDFFDQDNMAAEQLEQPAQASSFRDVPANAYYREAVEWAVEQNITGGTGANTFSPNASCTRGQIVTFLWRSAGSPTPKGQSNPFKDINKNDYYYEAVLWAAENGITGGTSASTFSPNTAVTRGQTVTFLYRAAGAPAAGSSDFRDVSESAYYARAVAWAYQAGITSGTGNGKFSPDANCTRAQIVTMLYRASTN